MITKRIRVCPTLADAYTTPGDPVHYGNGGTRAAREYERLFVVDWIAAARIGVGTSIFDASPTSIGRVASGDDQRWHPHALVITWATTGAEEVLGWVRDADTAEAWLADLEVSLEMVNGWCQS